MPSAQRRCWVRHRSREAGNSEQQSWADCVWGWLDAKLNPFYLDVRERAIQKLTKKLRVEAVAHSNVIDVTYRGYTPQTAQAVVAKLVDLYLDEHVRLNRTPRAHEFLSEQTSRLNGDLKGLEQELHDLMNRESLVSAEGRQKALDKNLRQAEDDLRETMASLAASECRSKGLPLNWRRWPRWRSPAILPASVTMVPI